MLDRQTRTLAEADCIPVFAASYRTRPPTVPVGPGVLHAGIPGRCAGPPNIGVAVPQTAVLIPTLTRALRFRTA